ncbi:MAG: NAD(P)/FAD-dependent oxidoreductase [Clostridia bacterium]|nr:NAD(P)/FAD-dependent oxidoreductase [Clostridia bacterium]
MSRYVIVGNGTAAIGCVEGIRFVDPLGKITVLSKENHPAYCRPLISYFLEDKTDPKKMLYRAETFYEDNGCEVLYNVSATALDPETKTLTLDSGDTLSYDKICVATGSSPFVPPMENLENVKNRFSFLTLDDAKALKKAVKPSSRVLIIGAGLIGLKCAEGLRAITKNITVCDLADHVLSSILDAKDAAFVQKHLEANDLKFTLHNSVAKFKGNTAIMQNGDEIPFDILVTAVGVRANWGLVKDAGGACGRAITVNEKMETSLEDVYAAGDCTESTDISDSLIKVMALMPNAYMQGYTAGINMAGGEKVFDNAIPMNSIGFFGLHMMTAGSRKGQMKTDIQKDSIKRFYKEDGKLIGFVLIGDVQNAGVYTNILRNQIPIKSLSEFNIKKSPSMATYDEEFRRKTLESVVK